MKEALLEKEMTCLLEAAKSNLMIGLKHRDASLHKLKLGQYFFFLNTNSIIGYSFERIIHALKERILVDLQDLEVLNFLFQ